MIVSFVGTLLFGLVHSLLASKRVKEAVAERIGDRSYHGLYLALYNVVAVLTFAALVLYVMLRPGEIIWQVPDPWAPLLLVIQAVGLIGLLVSLVQVNLLHFTGLPQMFAFMNGDPLPLAGGTLQTGGLYRFVRHPLYLFTLMIVWPVPTMTASYLGLVLGITVYVVIGSRIEERRLLQQFGDPYREYGERVPWVLPLPKNNS